ncbi:hypothetical protein AMS68_000315 [Peltaster fructicola]|uniref:Abscisic acid G-protein coupled receptor-like domain-containing protein n=1 Tax=Peltaster fructicola TaxID=286661 RepID=A0A6H0XJI8_9PEZI|nr:hypothetical protein AMS68_000315 [Peltaster fructicola]
MFLDDCLDCGSHKPVELQRRLDTAPPTTVLLSLLPFAATWVVVSIIASQRLWPSITGDARPQTSLPQFKNGEKSKTTTLQALRRPNTQIVARVVFSVSIGLSAVLAELLLCEISNTLHPAARSLALQVTLTWLLALSVLVTPAIEIHSFAKTMLTPQDSTSTKRSTSRARLVLELGLFASWLLVFWYIPQVSILREALVKADAAIRKSDRILTEACLERVGIIGISLLASLAGFAAVASLWQTFGVRHKTVKESDISRKEAGLTATEEMLLAKQSRLRALQQRTVDSPKTPNSAGFMGRVVGTFRGSSEAQELKALEMEVSGLETMRFSLSQSLSTLRARYAEQELLRTKTGRLLNVFNTVFALYCAYRIGATSISTVRRWWQPDATFASADPINNVISLLNVWHHAASILSNAVLQTFRLFSRFAPTVLQHAQTSLPLVISQVAGTYVISSALLLRANLPAEVSGVITEALGAPLESSFVEAWFESWFLVAVGLTAVGIFIGRKVAGGNDDWDDDGTEMEKRH